MSDTRRRRIPRPVREQLIIDAAIGVFAKRGYHASSVDEIAELAGISKPMVYLYLDSKEGLFLACLRREAERLVAAFRAAAGPAPSPSCGCGRGCWRSSPSSPSIRTAGSCCTGRRRS